MKKFDGKVVLITGGARGIGYAVAEAFGAEGASIALCDVDENEAVEAAAKLASAFGIPALGIKADVSASGDCEKVTGAANEKFGRIDVLVNNAGITRDTLCLRMSEAQWDAVLDVNLKGAFLMSQAAMKKMIKQRSGRIINVSSIVGQMGNAGQANYSASKSGLIGLTKSLARELSGRNILVNAVAPGFINTRMTEAIPEEAKTKLMEAIPLKRFGQPKDVAQAILFLAGDESSYITGQVLAVNGGMYM